MELLYDLTYLILIQFWFQSITTHFIFQPRNSKVTMTCSLSLMPSTHSPALNLSSPVSPSLTLWPISVDLTLNILPQKCRFHSLVSLMQGLSLSELNYDHDLLNYSISCFLSLFKTLFHAISRITFKNENMICHSLTWTPPLPRGIKLTLVAVVWQNVLSSSFSCLSHASLFPNTNHPHITDTHTTPSHISQAHAPSPQLWVL